MPESLTVGRETQRTESQSITFKNYFSYFLIICFSVFCIDCQTVHTTPLQLNIKKYISCDLFVATLKIASTFYKQFQRNSKQVTLNYTWDFEIVFSFKIYSSNICLIYSFKKKIYSVVSVLKWLSPSFWFINNVNVRMVADNDVQLQLLYF